MERVVLNEREEFLAKKIVHAAFVVHKELGPGLLEKVYEICMCTVLESEGIKVQRQVAVPINFRGLIFEDALRMDLFVEDAIICELKAVETVNPVWEAQILSHLRLCNKKVGFLINFHVPRIQTGIRRYLNHTK